MIKRSMFMAAAWLACSSPLWAQSPRGASYNDYYDQDADGDAQPSPRRRAAPSRRPAAASQSVAQRSAPVRDDAEPQPPRRYSQQSRARQAAASEEAPRRVRPTTATMKLVQNDAPPPPPPAADMETTPPPSYGRNNNQNQQGSASPLNAPYDGPWNGSQLDGMNPNFCGCDGPCESCGGCGCEECGGRCRKLIYARGEYLSWWLRGDSPPPLVTTSPAGTAQSAAGQLGQPGTSVLFGGAPINNTQRSGARITLGMWLNDATRIEGEWFGLGTAVTNFNASSDGSTILARPFYDMNPTVLGQDAKLIGYPGTYAGSIHASETSRFLGAGLNATYNVLWTDYGPRQRRIDFIYGFRYLRLSEGLSISDQTDVLSSGGIVPAGTIYNTYDGFKATNNFYGLNLGVMSENRWNRLSLTSIGRLAIGSTVEHVTINGNSTVTTTSGGGASYAGGLLAQPTNIGSYQHQAFTLAPQLELKLSYYFRPNLRAMVGYDLLYWSNVARPGAQVNPNVNTTQSNGGTLAGPPSPNFVIHQNDLWVQGVSVGGEWTF